MSNHARGMIESGMDDYEARIEGLTNQLAVMTEDRNRLDDLADKWMSKAEAMKEVVDLLLDTCMAVHHQLKSGEASEGDASDIDWCTKQLIDAISNAKKAVQP